MGAGARTEERAAAGTATRRGGAATRPSERAKRTKKNKKANRGVVRRRKAVRRRALSARPDAVLCLRERAALKWRPRRKGEREETSTRGAIVTREWLGCRFFKNNKAIKNEAAEFVIRELAVLSTPSLSAPSAFSLLCFFHFLYKRMSLFQLSFKMFF